MTNTRFTKNDSQEFKQAKAELIRQLSTHKKFADIFVNKLLTPSEQIMLVKRFAAIWMYSQGYSQYKVWNLLDMSPATASRIQKWYQKGACGEIIKTLPPRETSEFLQLVFDFINSKGSISARRRLSRRVGL